MKRLRYFLLACMLAYVTGGISAAGQDDRIKTVDEMLTRYNQVGLFNGAALLADHGRIVYEKGFGFANFEWQIPNTPNTKFRVNSMTKALTAILVFQLANNKQLGLDHPIAEYLPYYRKDTGSKVTVRQLLVNSSCIPDLLELPGIADQAARRWAVKDFVQQFCSGDLQCVPGQNFKYSQTNWYLLGAILEQVAGKSYGQLLQERIFAPTGMKDSSYVSSDVIMPRRAAGYEKTLTELRNERWIDPSVYYAIAGVYSTAEDLYHLDEAFYTDKLLSPEYMKLAFQPTGFELAGTKMGYIASLLPVNQPGQPERVLYKFEGAHRGFHSLMIRDVAQHQVLVLWSNTGVANLSYLARQIAIVLAGGSYDPVRHPLREVLGPMVANEGGVAAVAKYRTLEQNEPSTFDFSEDELNEFAYFVMTEGRVTDAVELLKLNVERHPNSFNAYDSLGEAYARAGQVELAKSNYAKSLALNPDNENAKAWLKKLGSLKPGQAGPFR